MYFCSFFLAPAFTTDLDGGGGGEGGGGGGGGETLSTFLSPGHLCRCSFIFFIFLGSFRVFCFILQVHLVLPTFRLLFYLLLSYGVCVCVV